MCLFCHFCLEFKLRIMVGFFCDWAMNIDLFFESLFLCLSVGLGLILWDLFKKFLCQIYIEIGSGSCDFSPFIIIFSFGRTGPPHALFLLFKPQKRRKRIQI